MEQRSFETLTSKTLLSLSLTEIPKDIDFDLSLSKEAIDDIAQLEKCSSLSELEMGKFMVG